MPKKKKEIIDRNLCSKKPYRKQNIPKAIREQCWIASFGKVLNINVMLIGVKI